MIIKNIRHQTMNQQECHTDLMWFPAFLVATTKLRLAHQSLWFLIFHKNPTTISELTFYIGSVDLYICSLNS